MMPSLSSTDIRFSALWTQEPVPDNHSLPFQGDAIHIKLVAVVRYANLHDGTTIGREYHSWSWLPPQFLLQQNYTTGPALSTIFSDVGIPMDEPTLTQLTNLVSSISRDLPTISQTRCATCTCRFLPKIVLFVLITKWVSSVLDESSTLLLLGLGANDDVFRPVPASGASIQALQKVEAIDGGACGSGSGSNDDQCAICFEKLWVEEEGLEVSRMPCSHMFHGDCIVRWLNTSHFCPLCRYKMPIS